jgi:hypothetical protein
LGLKDLIETPQIAYIAVIPTIAFWMLDGYYLAAERAFRRTYMEAISARRLILNNPKVTFSEFAQALFSWQTCAVYLCILAMCIVIGTGVVIPAK